MVVIWVTKKTLGQISKLLLHCFEPTSVRQAVSFWTSAVSKSKYVSFWTSAVFANFLPTFCTDFSIDFSTNFSTDFSTDFFINFSTDCSTWPLCFFVLIIRIRYSQFNTYTDTVKEVLVLKKSCKGRIRTV